MQRGCVINFNLIFDILILITSYVYMFLGTTGDMEASLIIFGLTIVISDSIIFILLSKGLPASFRDLLVITAGDTSKISTGTRLIAQVTTWLNVGLYILLFVSLFVDAFTVYLKFIALAWLVCFIWMEVMIQKTYRNIQK